MKWLFYLLILLNAALLGWNLYLRPPQPVSAPPAATVSTPGRRLALLDEVPPPLASRTAPQPLPAPEAEQEPEPLPVPAEEGEQALEPPPPVSEPEPPLVHCYRAGGIEQEAQLAALAQRLEEAGAQVDARGEEQREKMRYWVLLRGYRSPGDAAPVLERLRSAGLKDFYLVRSGEYKNTISLGVFSTAEAARRRQQQVQRLGFEPRVDEMGIPLKRWWLRFAWRDEGRPEAWRQAFPPLSPEGVEAAPCELPDEDAGRQ